MSGPASRDRPTYSLPIATLPGLVLESDRKGFIAAVDPGRIVRVGSGKLLAPGTYVTFTKTTFKGDLLFHDVLESTPPDVDIRLKASIVTVDESQVSLRAHFNNAILTCATPGFEVSPGMRVLFSASWSPEGLQADRVTGPDDSYRSHTHTRTHIHTYLLLWFNILMISIFCNNARTQGATPWLEYFHMLYWSSSRCRNHL